MNGDLNTCPVKRRESGTRYAATRIRIFPFESILASLSSFFFFFFFFWRKNSSHNYERVGLFVRIRFVTRLAGYVERTYGTLEFHGFTRSSG